MMIELMRMFIVIASISSFIDNRGAGIKRTSASSSFSDYPSRVVCGRGDDRTVATSAVLIVRAVHTANAALACTS